MANIAITGGTGFVGSALATALKRDGHTVFILTRNANATNRGEYQYISWNPQAQTCDTSEFHKIDAAILLGGANISKNRWSATTKKEIASSRVDGTYFITEKLRQFAPNCKRLIAASATGFYGADRNGIAAFTEEMPPSDDFLGTTCKAWENASMSAADFAKVTILRLGIVLGRDEGAFPAFSDPLRYKAAPILGSGHQIISWIHLNDLVSMIIYSLNNNIVGTFNAVAPQPVSYRRFMDVLCTVKGGIFFKIPVPGLMLRIMLGEFAGELLKSCTVSCDKIQNTGFVFSYPDLSSALKSILHQS
jgi:uncharacterized protein